MLLIKLSKLSIPRSFSMSIIWKILTGLLLSLSLTFTALFQNQVDWILPAFFSWQHLYASCWFSWHMLSNMKSLPGNHSWHRSSDLFWRSFLLTSTLRLSFLHFNFTITDSFFFKRWQACNLSSLTSCLVKENALQMFTSSSSSLIDEVTGFTSTDSRQWYWAFVTAFLSNWTTFLQFYYGQFITVSCNSYIRWNNFKSPQKIIESIW